MSYRRCFHDPHAIFESTLHARQLQRHRAFLSACLGFFQTYDRMRERGRMMEQIHSGREIGPIYW